jgi:uncharacterized repeat protein (TIGR02543 family)
MMKRMVKGFLSILLVVLMLSMMIMPSIAATGSVDWDPNSDDIYNRTFVYWDPVEGGSVVYNGDSHWVDVVKLLGIGYYQASFTATANPGYVFSGWSYKQQKAVFYGDVYAFSESGNTLTIRLVGTDVNKNATAHFTPIEYSVTANAGAGGSASVSSADGAPYYYNEEVTFTAVPDSGYAFDGWYNGSTLVSNSQTYTVNVTGDISLTAQFIYVNEIPVANDDYETTYKGIPVYLYPMDNDWDDGTGLKITSLGTPGHGTATFDAWGSVEYEPEAGFTGTDSFEYTIEDDLGETATATIHVTVYSPSLTVTKTADDDSVYLGDNVKYTITIKNDGDVYCDYFRFYDDLLDQTIIGGGLGIGDTYTYEYIMAMNQIGSITNNVTVTGCWGSFEQYYLYSAEFDNGDGDNDIPLEEFYRVVREFTASEVVTVSERPAPPPAPVTNYSLTIGIEGSGTVLPGAGTYARSSGTVQILQVSPADGYRFDGWAGDNGSEVVADGTNYRIVINGNKTIIARFVEETTPIIEDEQIPESGDQAGNESDIIEQEEIVSDEPVPQGTLPQTGGIPLVLLMGAGFALTTGGMVIRKPARKGKK